MGGWLCTSSGLSCPCKAKWAGLPQYNRQSQKCHRSLALQCPARQYGHTPFCWRKLSGSPRSWCEPCA